MRKSVEDIKKSVNFLSVIMWRTVIVLGCCVGAAFTSPLGAKVGEIKISGVI